jgi:predicted nucleotidyltransferase
MGSPQPDLSSFLAALTLELQQRGLHFMLIGGQAVLLHGRPRFTEDVDVTLAAGPAALPLVRAACEALDLSPLAEDPDAFARRTFVLPVRQTASRIRVDFIFSTTDYEAQAVARATRVLLAGAQVPFATAEDLLIHKLFAGRPRDIEDAEGIVRRRGAQLDWTYLERWAAEFALVPGREGMPVALERLKAGL